MAVYTEVTDDSLADFLADYDIGTMVAFRGIAEGVENSNFSLVSQANPAHASDILVFYTTGMGQTTPPLITGQIVPSADYNTALVTVTIGGVNANVIYSIAAPPYVAGLYQMAVTVPSGLAPGNQPVVATSGGLQSNTVTIVVQ